MTHGKRSACIGLSVALSLAMSACGKSEPKQDPVKPAAKESVPAAAEKKAEAPPAEPGVLAADDKGVVKLEASDAMKFNAKEIRVKAGSKVKVYLKHTGKLEADIMGHNFVLLKKGVDLAAFAKAAIEAKDKEYIPSEDDVIAHTRVVGGGKRVSVTFDAPEAGTYEFLCSFPGHSAMMKGQFIVE